MLRKEINRLLRKGMWMFLMDFFNSITEINRLKKEINRLVKYVKYGAIHFRRPLQNFVFLTPPLLPYRIPSKIIEPLPPRDIEYIEHPPPHHHHHHPKKFKGIFT